MTPTHLLNRAHLCHKSADAIKARIGAMHGFPGKGWMRERKLAESLEALADRLEREALELHPEWHDGPR
jgi:hypothetical protein